MQPLTPCQRCFSKFIKIYTYVILKLTYPNLISFYVNKFLCKYKNFYHFLFSLQPDVNKEIDRAASTDMGKADDVEIAEATEET